MVRVIAYIFFSLLLIDAGWASAAIGTTTAEFLTFTSDARISAMGNSSVAVFDNSDSFTSNPASLGMLGRKEFNLSTMKLNGFDDGLTEGAKVVNGKYMLQRQYTPRGFGPFGGYGNWGFHLNYTDYGAIPITTNTPDAIGSFTAWNLAAGVYWGNRVERNKIFRNMPFGIGVKYIHQSLGDASSMGFATDLGVAYLMPKSSKLRGLHFGLSILNVGFASAFVNESDPLPMTFKAGFAYRFFMSSIVRAFGGPRKVFKTLQEDAIISFDATQSIGNNIVLGTGLELTFLEMIAVRAGSELLEDERNLTVGMGFKFNKAGSSHRFDFAWVPQTLLGDNFRLTYRYVWGSTGGRSSRKLRKVIEFQNQEKDIDNPFDLEDDTLEESKTPKKKKRRKIRRKRRGR